MLGGCAGGGGGGGDGGGAVAPTVSGPVEVPFTSFSAVQSNQTVVVSGVSQNLSGTTTSLNGPVTAANLSAVDSASTTGRLTYDASNALSGIAMSSPQASTSLNRNAGDSVTCSTNTCSGSDAAGVNQALIANPASSGWNYQTFGIWGSETATNFNLSFGSFGAATPGSAVPSVGSATFNGTALGAYADSAGTQFVTGADMTANVNFGTRSIAFSTANTITRAGAVTSAAPGLNLSGNLTYAAGSGQFTGTVSTANAALTGSTTGRFYGPNAEEIGGVYGLSGSGVSRMVGAYGGRR